MKNELLQREIQTVSQVQIPQLFPLDKKLSEEKAESLTFSHNSNQNYQPSSTSKALGSSFEIDKDKLYETFVLFQNFMNNQPNQSWYDGSNYKKTILQDKIDQISLNKLKDDKDFSFIDEKAQLEVPQASTLNNRNYDDIPIKSTNVNFIELVEKNLANDKTEEKGERKKRIIKKGKTMDKLTPVVNKSNKTYQKPLYSSHMTEDNFDKRNPKATTKKKIAIYKKKDNLFQNDYQTPRKGLSNLKYEQISKSLRKTNTDFRPYMTLTRENINFNLASGLDKSDWEEAGKEKENELSRNDCAKEASLKEMNESIDEHEDNNHNEGNLNTNDLEGHNTSFNNIKEESFHIITEMNSNNPETIPLNHSNDAFSNDNEDSIIVNDSKEKDEPKENETQSKTKNDHINQFHPQNILSVEIEPIQSNTVPVSSKLFDPNKNYTNIQTIQNEGNYDKRLQTLNNEIRNFQEEKRKVTTLKEEYIKLHHRLEVEIEELSTQKAKFIKWKEEETKRIQSEKKNNEKLKIIINDLKKENQILKASEMNYKSQIERLTSQIKDYKKETKDKEYINQLNISSSKVQNPSLLGKSKLYRTPNTQRNHLANSAKFTKQRSPKDISFSSPSQSTSVSNYNNPNIYKKIIPKQELKSVNCLTKTEQYDFCIPEEYLNTKYDLIKEEMTQDGKKIKQFTNNKKEITFISGVRKEIYRDGHQIVNFPNGDMKQIFNNGQIVYYFKDTKTVQTSFDDGLQVFKFINGQIEKHFPEGKKEIFFADGSYRIIRSDGSEETFFSDGTIQKIDGNNIITIEKGGSPGELTYSK